MKSYKNQLEEEIQDLKKKRSELMELVQEGGADYDRKFFEIHSHIHSIDQSIQAKKDRIANLNKTGTYLEPVQLITPINK